MGSARTSHDKGRTSGSLHKGKTCTSAFRRARYLRWQSNAAAPATFTSRDGLLRRRAPT